MTEARASGPPSFFGLGHVVAMRRDPLAFLTEAASYGGLVPLRFGSMDAWLVSEPKHVQELLTEGEEKTRKGFGNENLRPLIGDGLFLSEGEAWQRRRDALRPLFEVRRFQAIAAPLRATIEEQLAAWPIDEDFELFPRVQSLTMAALTRALFGRDLTAKAPDLLDLLARLWGEVERRAASVIPFIGRLPLPRNRRFSKSKAELDALAREIIDGPREGLLAALAPDALTTEELRNEVVTFLVAGQECTSISIAWSLLLLARHPEAAAAVRTALPGSDDELDGCWELRRAYDEALRLYPPAWLIARQANEAFDLGAQRIARDDLLLVAPWVQHRLDRFWTEPLPYRPERWITPPRPGVFMPFGIGPRVCLGRPLALLIARLTLGLALRRFECSAPGAMPEPRPGLTLRPAPGAKLRLTPRLSATASPG